MSDVELQKIPQRIDDDGEQQMKKHQNLNKHTRKELTKNKGNPRPNLKEYMGTDTLARRERKIM